MILILFILGALAIVYYLAIKPYNYWAKKNVETGKFTPVFGDNLWLVQGKESFPDWIRRMYEKLPNARYVGIYQFQKPVLMLKSPELIKQICVKDCDHFADHNIFIPDGVDDLWSSNLMALQGQRWKNMRSTLTPCFTSSKMKSMCVLMCDNAEVFVQHFLKMDKKVIELKVKDYYARYTNDVIASCAFGVQVDSLKDRENEFFNMGKLSTTISIWRKLIFLCYLMAPKLAAFFNLPFFDKRMKSFFINLVKDTIRIREEQNIKRPDMIGLLMAARKGQEKDVVQEEIKEDSFAVPEDHFEMKNINKNLTDIDIAAQSFFFFIAGFETASTTMSFMSYELALNPDIQKRLIEEIDEHKPQNGSPTYETIVGMTYLDMVVSETLRKWPISVIADRMVTKPFTIQPELPHEKPLHLERNVDIKMSLYGIHRDPKYYKNPEKFDPERFSYENRKYIVPYTYMPFGVGPRNCIGSRFALLVIKAMFFYLLSNFKIVVIGSTELPLKLDKTALVLTPKKSFCLGLKRRT